MKKVTSYNIPENISKLPQKKNVKTLSVNEILKLAESERIKDNLATLKEFLNKIFPNDNTGFIEFRNISSNGGKTEKKFYSSVDNIILDLEKIESKNKTHNIYFGVNLRIQKSGKKEDDFIANTLWADFDADISNVDEKLKTLGDGFHPTFIINSGHGFHFYWILKEPVELKDYSSKKVFEDTLKNIAIRFNADTAVCDVSRIMRLPYTKNMKEIESPVETSIIKVNLEKKFCLEDFNVFSPMDDDNILEINTGGSKITITNHEFPLELKPCIEEYLKTGVEKSLRNKVGYMLACEFRRLKKPLELARKTIIDWNKRNTPPMNDSEIKDKLLNPINKAYVSKNNYGCNNSLLVAKCAGKEKCGYYAKFKEGVKTEVFHDEGLFYFYRYDKILKGFEVETYKAIVKLEKKNVVQPGECLLTSLRIIAGQITEHNYQPEEIRRVILKFVKMGLIKYKPGDHYPGGKGSQIFRVIPIPNPITTNQPIICRTVNGVN